MCGIAGLVLPAGVNVSELELAQTNDLSVLSNGMLYAIQHRGPDSAGRIIGPWGFAGNVRLSIVDLASGTQPLSNEDQSVWIVYNGEIYDVEKHRAQLIAKGHHFSTRSDTEVLVHLYEEYGDNLTQHINGEYAFALFDSRRRRWLMARDPFGIRPLYYRLLRRGALLFASEVKPLIWAAGEHSVSLEPEAFIQTLQGWAVMPPLTAFKDILQLPPGSTLSIDADGTRTVRDFFSAVMQGGNASDDLSGLVGQAVQRRLVADVPVGIYLSGGLDSSIVAFECTHGSRHPTHSFSIRFEDAQFDEGSEQKLIRDQLGTIHHEVSIAQRDIRENFSAAVIAAESIVFRSAFVPMYILSEEVNRAGIRTVLTGEGADELFGGYDIFRELKLLTYFSKHPSSSRIEGLLARLYPFLPQYSKENVPKLVPYYRSLLTAIPGLHYGHEARWRNLTALSRLVTADATGGYPEALKGFDRFAGTDVWESCRQTEILTLLHGYLLSTQGDRMAAAHSVETRLPFLDIDVARHAFAIPLQNHISGLREKVSLHRAYDAKLPARVARKRKTPFVAPDAEVFFSAANQDWRDLLSEDSLRGHPFLNISGVTSLMRALDNQFSRNQSVSRRDNTAFFALLSSRILEQHLASAARKTGVMEFARDVRL